VILMIFEIFNRNGHRVFWTEYETCIPSKEQLKHMQKVSGYIFKLDGKRYKP